MEKLNEISDKLVWDMFTDSGGMENSGQVYLETSRGQEVEQSILKINEITNNPIFISLWEKKIIISEFASIPLEDFLEENPNLTEEELQVVTDLSQVLDQIFEPW